MGGKKCAVKNPPVHIFSRMHKFMPEDARRFDLAGESVSRRKIS